MKNLFVIFILVFIVLILGLFFIFSKKKNLAEIRKITFITKDGVNIVANYYPNKEAKFAGILIHSRPATKENFDELAKFLQKEGYAILTIDLRGHGESINSVFGKLNYQEFTEEEEKKSIEDLVAASLFLEKEGFLKSNQFLIGASIGANLSFQFLSENLEIKAAILISPGLNYRGIILENFKKNNLNEKIFTIVAKDDFIAVQAGKTIKSWYPESYYLEYFKGGHGIDLFNSQPELKEKILIWLREKLF